MQGCLVPIEVIKPCFNGWGILHHLHFERLQTAGPLLEGAQQCSPETTRFELDNLVADQVRPARRMIGRSNGLKSRKNAPAAAPEPSRTTGADGVVPTSGAAIGAADKDSTHM